MQDVPRRNVELKARDPTPRASLDLCFDIGASDQGLIWQRDTYFEVPRGRLKLREQRPGFPHLVQYVREDGQEARLSSYRIARVQEVDPLLAMLDACLGIRVVVTKQRRLFLWEGVRIHIDEVEGLGTFIELEAVAAPEASLGAERALIRELRGRFGITEDRLISVGYAEQLMRAL